MNPTIQPGMHPDADTLTAFAEQLLTANEREQVLTHAAVCGRCREVIFLAERASAAEPATTATALSSASPQNRRTSWWGGWRWAWIPASAFAVFVGAAVVMHFRNAEIQTQMARNTAPNDALPQHSPPSPPANIVQPKSAESNAPQKAKSQSARDQRVIQEKEEALDEKGITGQHNPALAAPAPIVNVSPGLAGGSLRGAFKARAKDTPYGGPVANELQQNAIQQQNALQQNSQLRQNPFQAAQGFDQKSANHPLAPTQAPVPVSSQTATVQVNAEEAKSTAQPSAPPMQLSYVPTSGKNLELSSAAIAQLKKTAAVDLPGGVQPLSVAFAAPRAVAIDTSGALFLSEDQGKHWQPIPTQWTGRAVLVRNMQPSTDKADALQAVQTIPAAHFELVNDKLQTWKSSDGKTWTAEPLPNK